MDYNETKGLLASKTAWGCLVAMLPFIHDVALTFLTGAPISDQAAVAMVGALSALIGRLRATKDIKGLF